ncbi:protein-disulfide reductase DsbD family protein [Vibrio sp.]|nr:protein-disulfide reductase DsbD family protein [Vibrio sp.]
MPYNPIYKTILFVFTLIFSQLFVISANAQTTGWLQDPHHPPIQVRMTTTGAVHQDKQQIEVILDAELEGDWKTYWRSPGEGGVPPEFKWDKSDNVSNVTWSWPMPAYYDLLGLSTLGYKHKVSFPLLIDVVDLNKPVHLKGTLTFPTCTTICVITDYPISLSFTPSALNKDSEAAFRFAQGLSFTPQDNEQFSIDATYWDQKEQTLSVQLSQKSEWKNPVVLVDGKDIVDDMLSQPDITLSGNVLLAQFKVSNWLGEANLDKRNIIVTVSDDLILSESTTIIESTTPITINGNNQDINLFAMFGFALLGGLILNIMPCVLPVLGMKLNSLIFMNEQNAQDNSKAKIRKAFLASSAGIIASFLAIAAGLTALKVAGQSVGWGIQFQSLGFIIFMTLLTLGFAMNLMGLFEIRLPASLNTWAATKGDNSSFGHFTQGAFATLLATPCSAPFLGTAVAYALGASYFEMWAIFVALGVGMSLPWLLFALFPSLVRYMPKPGGWMNKVKYTFGGMMLLTALWLLTLLENFIGQLWVSILLAATLVLLMILIAKKHGTKSIVYLLAGVMLFAGGGLIIGSVTADKWATPLVDDIEWQQLNTAEIPKLIKQGKTVFVDVTADWCITCKANKIGVLLQDPVYSALKSDNVVTMKGDWTRPSNVVTDYLHSHNRFGVPFNIVYSPEHPQGIALPVILDSGDVLKALEGKSLDGDQ